MEKFSSKLIKVLVILLILITAMSCKIVTANDENTSALVLQKADGNKIIYINGLEKEDFKYAFSNDTDVNANVTYIPNLQDDNGSNVALLQNGDDYKYIFVLKQNEVEPEVIELANEKSITDNQIDTLDALTKTINVEIKEDDRKTTDENGVQITKGREKVVINDKGNYKYELIEVVDKNNSTEKLNETAVDLYNKIHTTISSSDTMYDKFTTQMAIEDDFNKLIENANWEDVQNKEIYEPENVQDGEVFIVLISGEGKNDLQILTCTRKDDQGIAEKNTVVEKKVEKRTALPVTGENLAIYIALAIVVILIIALSIRMKHVKGKENEDK